MANVASADFQAGQGLYSSGLTDTYVNGVFAGQVLAPVGVAPVWTVVSPPAGTHITPTTPIVVQVTVTTGLVQTYMPLMKFATFGTSELVAGLSLLSPYLGTVVVALVTPLVGFQLTILRTGGWPDKNITMDGLAFDGTGTSGVGTFSWIVDFPTSGAVVAAAQALTAEGARGRDFLIDPVTKDVVLTAGGDLALNGFLAPAIAQAIQQAVKNFLGECILDETLGVDYFGLVLVKNPDFDTIGNLFRGIISQVEGVASVDSLVLNHQRATRTLGISFTVTSDAGQLIADSFAVNLPALQGVT